MRLFAEDIIGGVNERYWTSRVTDKNSSNYSSVFNKKAQGYKWLCVKTLSESHCRDVANLFSQIVLIDKGDNGVDHPVIGLLGEGGTGKTGISSGIINVNNDFQINSGYRNRFTIGSGLTARKPCISLGQSHSLGGVVWGDLFHDNYMETGTLVKPSDVALIKDLQTKTGVTIFEHAQITTLYNEGYDTVILVNRDKDLISRDVTFVVREDSGLAPQLAQLASKIQQVYQVRVQDGVLEHNF